VKATRRNVIVIGGGHNGLVTAALLAKGGLKPLLLDNVRVWGVVDQDLTLFCLGPAQVALTGLEQIQAADRGTLGRVKGEALRELALAVMGEAVARHEREPGDAPAVR